MLIKESKLYKTLSLCFIFIRYGGLWITLSLPCYASDRYFLCGPDEDGCFEESYSSCICIPVDPMNSEAPYCLDFDDLKCTPLSTRPDCSPKLTFNNQNECLATIFQSEPTPPCSFTTLEFCLQKHMMICDPTGQLGRCKKA